MPKVSCADLHEDRGSNREGFRVDNTNSRQRNKARTPLISAVILLPAEWGSDGLVTHLSDHPWHFCSAGPVFYLPEIMLPSIAEERQQVQYSAVFLVMEIHE